MKFAHFSDVHIGGWREEPMKTMQLEAFQKGVEICIGEKVDFILIAGDLFNTALPPIDQIRDVAASLKKLRDEYITVYLIPGSHDFSPSGKTMIEVLEKAGLCHNVFKLKNNNLQFTVDAKTGVKLTGILGLACGLDKRIYEKLDKSNLEKEPGFKIFLFHTIIDEYKPEHLKDINGEPLSSLPKGFNYYAGGHPHYIFAKKEDEYGLVAYPGALFPNNFMELEKFKGGGFYIVDEKLNYNHVMIMNKEVECFKFDVDKKSASEAESDIIKEIKKHDLKGKITTIRVKGTLSSGKTSDVNFKKIIESIKDPYCVLTNKAKLQSREFEEVEVETGNVEDVEMRIISEHLKNLDFNSFNGKDFAVNLMNLMNKEKDEGERKVDFESRLVSDFIKSLGIEEVWK
ncbi:MAG: exonuclease SbcCD subunit D [Nanoarchaeota archaeon]